MKETTSETASKFKEKVTDNEKFMEVVENVKDKTIATGKAVKEKTTEFIQREDVQENIEKAKAKTVDIAEKGVGKLKKWLSPKKVNNVEPDQDDK